MVKWFVTDMDGTFLNDNREISPRSKAVMKKLQDKGVKFFIATGRLDLAVKGYYYSMGLNDALISCNGSLIRNLTTGEIFYSKSFERNQLEIIYEKYKKLTDGSINFHIYSTNFIYSDRLSENLARIKKVDESVPEEWRTPIKITDNVIEELYNNKDECYKVMMSSTNHDLLRKIYKEVNDIFPLEGTFSARDYYDFMPLGCGKGDGIKKIAEYYNIDIADSVVFGDNFNDVGMLKVAGTSVCPSNASEEIQKLCDEVIGDNNEFSVLTYIENYVDTL